MHSVTSASTQQNVDFYLDRSWVPCLIVFYLKQHGILRVMCYFFLTQVERHFSRKLASIFHASWQAFFTQVDKHFSRKLTVNLLCHGPKNFAGGTDPSWDMVWSPSPHVGSPVVYKHILQEYGHICSAWCRLQLNVNEFFSDLNYFELNLFWPKRAVRRTFLRDTTNIQ